MGLFNTLLYPEKIRGYQCNNIIKNSGWHITYLGGTDFITNKLQSFSETQACNSKNLNKSYLNSCISEGVLFFNDEKLTYIPIETNRSLPRYFLKK